MPLRLARLVDRVTLPDGTFYQINYETTPGDAHTPHYVTGRISSITLPTGGTISYDYTVGTHHGIECADGSTSGLKRTTPDGIWTYTRAIGTGAASTTTVVDPKNNTTVIQFQGVLETQRSTYQGSPLAANLYKLEYLLQRRCLTMYGNGNHARPYSAERSPRSWARYVQRAVEKVYTYNAYGLTTREDDYDWGRRLLERYSSPRSSPTHEPRQHQEPASDGNYPRWRWNGCVVGLNDLRRNGHPNHHTTVPGRRCTPQHVVFSGPRGNLTTLARCRQRHNRALSQVHLLRYRKSQDVHSGQHLQYHTWGYDHV